MESLVTEIKSEFRRCQAIEVFVLNERGDDQILLYRGAASRMRLRHLSDALVAPGCFYLITVNGFQIEESPSYSPTVVMKKEICWLTDPSVPNIDERTAKTAVVSWSQALICGLPSLPFQGSILYALEAAEGFEVNAATAKYTPEHQADVEFRLICRGDKLLRAEVVDLKPSTWYHFRMYIDFSGKRVYSPVKAMSTGKAPPEIPSNLQVRTEKKNTLYTTLRTARNVIRVTFSEPKNNGAGIERYLLQQMKIYVEESSRGKSLWENAYNNFSPEAILEGPSEDVLELRYRVKAKNSEGWSEFSDVVHVNRKSHPTLFRSTSKSSSGVNKVNMSTEFTSDTGNDQDVYDIYQAAMKHKSWSSPKKTSPPKKIDPAVAAAISSPTKQDLLLAFAQKVDDEISRILSKLPINKQVIQSIILPIMQGYEVIKEFEKR